MGMEELERRVLALERQAAVLTTALYAIIGSLDEIAMKGATDVIRSSLSKPLAAEERSIRFEAIQLIESAHGGFSAPAT